MQIELSKIIIRHRIRQNLGDLSSLMESMRLHGLMNPVVINSNNELIAGHRRTEAARRLGWQSIEVRVVDEANEGELLEMEIDENTERKPLTSDELAEGYLRLDRLRSPSFFRRIWTAIIRLFRRLFGRGKPGTKKQK